MPWEIDHVPVGEPYKPVPRCGATKKDGTICKAVAGLRTTHPGMGRCLYHGGSAPSVRKSYARRIADARAKEALTRLGTPLEIEPTNALLEMVYEAAGNVAFLGGEVASLDNALSVNSYEQMEIVKAVVTLYNDERDRLVRYSKTALDSGIAERTVKISERQGEALVEAIKAVITALKLDPEQRKYAMQVAGQQLRLLDGGEPSKLVERELRRIASRAPTPPERTKVMTAAHMRQINMDPQDRPG